MNRTLRYLSLTAALAAASFAPPVGGRPALASNCSFKQTFDGSDDRISNTCSAKVLLTNTQPDVICTTAGVSFWEMVTGPSQGYAQGGWLNDNTMGSQKMWDEWANTSGSFSDNYYAAPAGTNTYETDITTSGGATEYFSVNGTLFDANSLNWGQAGTGVQYAQENHSDDDYWGPDTFSAAYYCTIPSGQYQCSPGTVFSVSHNLGPTNSYECWYPLATNAFKVYDTRNNGNHC
jgi:hypothetical protein